MRPGSLVVVLPFPPYPPYQQFLVDKPVADGSTIYTIRSIENLYVWFEELSMGDVPGLGELGLHIRYVREVQPPMDLTNIAEFIIDAKKVALT